MRVLIISHNVFSSTESMGKTLASYFACFKPEELAQFYIHSQVPTSIVCNRYYRMTDKDAIKSIVGLSRGREFGIGDIDLNRGNARTDSGLTGTIYQKARKRTPCIYFARNLWWKLAHWESREFIQWLDAFCPECVFLASGDYAFIYDIALKIAKSRKVPLYISCMDDYYFNNKNSDSVLGRFQHKLFMQAVNRTMSYASKMFCICGKMSKDYSSLFNKLCITVHTPTTIREPLHMEKKKKISYLGNLGYNRDKQLIDIGRALKSLGLEPDHIDVYSTESRSEILANLTEENGIAFHGFVGAEDVLKIMGESLAVIHTESFDNEIRRSVKYSISTKIADSLASGTCIFAYGPEEIASISYLSDNKAAFCCTEKDSLENMLHKMIQDEESRNMIIRNALVLSKNHSIERTPSILKDELQPN